MRVGIDKIRVYGSRGALDIAALARARGLDPAETCGRYLVDERRLVDAAARLGALQLDPIKTTVVQGLRAMTTWVLGRPPAGT